MKLGMILILVMLAAPSVEAQADVPESRHSLAGLKALVVAVGGLSEEDARRTHGGDPN